MASYNYTPWLGGENISQFNDSLGLAYWEDAKIYQLKYKGCSSFKFLKFNEFEIMLNSWSEAKQAMALCDSRKILSSVIFWMVLLTGIPGNILALLTILQLPKTTSTFYVALLASFDLTQVLLKGLETMLKGLKSSTKASCKMLSFLTNFTGTYANWVLVLICFERFFTIRFPLKKTYYFTFKRARMSAVILGFVLLPFYAIHVWFLEESGGLCVFTEDHKDFYEDIWLYVEIVLYVFIPASLLLLMVILIAIELKEVQKTRKLIFCGSQNTDGGVSYAMAQRQLREQAKTERSITVMLFFAAVTFIVLCLPICIVTPLYFIYSDNTNSPFEAAQWDFAYTVSNTLVFLSHAINVFVYFFSASKFRSQLLHLLKCKCSSSTNRSNGQDHTLHSMVNE